MLGEDTWSESQGDFILLTVSQDGLRDAQYIMNVCQRVHEAFIVSAVFGARGRSRREEKKRLSADHLHWEN